jgi:hypothetical protein
MMRPEQSVLDRSVSLLAFNLAPGYEKVVIDQHPSRQ